MQIFIDKRKFKLSPKKIIGKGGEAEVYTLNKKEVVKLFKSPQHPDYSQDTNAQQSAMERLQEHQTKLQQFPQGLPQTVLAPSKLACDDQGKILGYTMPYLNPATPLYRYGDRRFREANGISQADVVKIFVQLHQTLKQIHQASVIIGDLNDLNILIQQEKPYFIDADSWQFKTFQSYLFTARFVDPLLCDQKLQYPQLIAPHNIKSDWYAFAVMLFRSLLYVEPYGGIYPDKKITHVARPLHRISVFNPKVKYPKPALKYKILSDNLLHYFHNCFNNDQRGEFPLQLLKELNWKKCAICGQTHARTQCPDCQVQIAVVALPNISNLKLIFSTQGTIIATQFSQTACHYLYWENGEFKRETGQIIFKGDRNPYLNFWLQGNKTYVGQGDTVLCWEGGEMQPEQTLRVDIFKQQPMFHCDGTQRFWVAQDKLWCDGTLGAESIGDVLAEQTCFWIEGGLGFGFYQAGSLLTGFIFESHRRGLNDQVVLPRIAGEIIAMNCQIGRDIWFFLTTQNRGQLQHHVCVIDRRGQLRSHQIFSETELPTIEGHCATPEGLLLVTDQGIRHWSILNGKIETSEPYPQLNALVQSNQTLRHNSNHLYLGDRQNLWQLH